MLTELRLTNFRIFNDEISVRFRPITVLIGRNSSGKSSIVKFLLMLQQSIASGGSQFLTTEGDKVNLGAFSELKNALTRKRNLTFELTTVSATSELDPALANFMGSLNDLDNRDLIYKAGATVSYSRRATTGRATYSVSNVSTGKHILRIINRILDDSVFWQHTPLHESTLDFSLGETRDQLFEPTWEELLQRAESIIHNLAEREVIGVPLYQIDSIRHLSPVRDESQRVIVASSPPSDNVGQQGEFTLPHLQQLVAERGDQYDLVLQYLQSVMNIDRVRFRTSSGYVSQAFARNQTTGADVLIADFGFGVSQCLPILVQGAIMSPHSTLMVEQPEAQLHPTAQLELGNFFADLWKQRQVASIIETHSDNILLRLRRLIARGDLPHEDVSVAYFTFDDNNGNMPIVKNLDINEDGSMQPGLPMEFFGADIAEGFMLGVRE